MASKLNTIILVLAAVCTITLAYDKEKCDAPPSVTGRCRASIPAWVYKDGKCQFLKYGGCGATPNIFLRLKSLCEASCLN
nr:PI-actitoxin-Afv2b-like [Drosophila takahashii]